MSRVPFDPVAVDREPPPVDPGPPGSLPAATLRLAFFAGLAWSVLALLALPGATERWLRAIRGVEGPPARAGRAGVLFLVSAYAPMVAWLAALAASEERRLAVVLAALGVSFSLVPLLVRAPLLLVSDRPEDRGLALSEALRRSLVAASAAPLESLTLALAQLGATLLALGLAYVVGTAGGAAAFVGLLLGFALPPLLWTPVMRLASRWTPEHTPAPTTRSLGVLALLLLPPLLAVATLAVLATKDPLPLEVLREGRGVQPVRGLMRESGARGALEHAGFSLRSSRWSEPWIGWTLVVDPTDGAPYPIAAEYDPALASMVARSCGADCESVTLEGPDWTMRVRLDERGRRLDDALLDRALARVGAIGTLAFGVGSAVVVVAWLILARLARRVRRLGGAHFRHRLPGRLRVGEGGAIERGQLVGASNRVELLDGSVTLRLPERLVPLAVDPALDTLEGLELVVSTNEPLALGTHRSADAPWPEQAALVLGAPAAIESAALVRASRTVALLVLVAASTSALSLLVLALR